MGPLTSSIKRCSEAKDLPAAHNSSWPVSHNHWASSYICHYKLPSETLSLISRTRSCRVDQVTLQNLKWELTLSDLPRSPHFYQECPSNTGAIWYSVAVILMCPQAVICHCFLVCFPHKATHCVSVSLNGLNPIRLNSSHNMKCTQIYIFLKKNND